MRGSQSVGVGVSLEFRVRREELEGRALGESGTHAINADRFNF